MPRRKPEPLPQITILPETPYAQDLAQACVALYAAVGVRRVSRHLEVCFCNVCMTEQTRQQIIATLNRDLSPALIREYSNSAHGTPQVHDDVMVLLPRYAELLAQNISVDYNESDEIFWRIGAVRLAGQMPRDVEAALRAWGRAYFLHAAYCDARDLDSILFAYGAVKLLLSGAWSGAEVIELLEEGTRDAQIGAQTTAWLASHVFRKRRSKPVKPDLDFIWTYGLQDGAREAVLAWFTGPPFRAALEHAMACDIPKEAFDTCYNAHDWIAAHRAQT